MLVCLEKQSEKWQSLIKAFTVKNKNIDRQENITWRDLSRMRYIKLYSSIWDKVYFPIGQFSSLTKKTKWLWFLFEYKDSKDSSDEWKEQLIAEQNMIMNDIDFEWRRTWLIEMKTGRWKSILQIKLTEHFQEKTLILCHNIKTLTELKKKFQDFSNYDPWVYYSKKKEIKEITITTHVSFIQSHDQFRWKFGLLLCDECDHWTSSDMVKAIIFSDCDALFWLTWTPYRQDLSTEDMTLIFWPHIKVKNQANNWYNIIPDIVRVMYNNSTVYSFNDRHDMKEQLMHDKSRLEQQIKFVQEAHKQSKIWLLLVDRVEECSIFYEQITNIWIPCYIMNWETKVEDDEIWIKQMKEQKWIIVWTSQKVWRWVDIPEIDAIYLFYPCRFEWQVVQAVWRALRTTPTKKSAILYDWCDIPVLKGQAYSRASTYKQEYIWCKITTLDINPKNNETTHESSMTNKWVTDIQNNEWKVIQQERLL